MVDVGAKKVTARVAVARGRVYMKAATLAVVVRNSAAKGDVLTVAQIAGIGAAKRTSSLIPLAHPLALDDVAVSFTYGRGWVEIESRVSCSGRTGVEMEALVAVSLACLTLYDMTKAIDKALRIENVRLVSKTKSD